MAKESGSFLLGQKWQRQRSRRTESCIRKAARGDRGSDSSQE